MKHKKSVYTTLALISQLGISMLVPILICVFLGVWLEDQFGLPLTIPLIILGVLAGARNVYVLVRQTIDQISREGEDKEE